MNRAVHSRLSLGMHGKVAEGGLALRLQVAGIAAIERYTATDWDLFLFRTLSLCFAADRIIL